MSHEIRKANERQNHGRGPCGQEFNPSVELCEYKVSFYLWAMEHGPQGSYANAKLHEDLWRWWDDQLQRARLRELPRHERGFLVNDQVSQSG